MPCLCDNTYPGPYCFGAWLCLNLQMTSFRYTDRIFIQNAPVSTSNLATNLVIKGNIKRVSTTLSNLKTKVKPTPKTSQYVKQCTVFNIISMQFSRSSCSYSTTRILTDESQCFGSCWYPPAALAQGRQRLVRRRELSDCDELYHVTNNHTQLLHFQSTTQNKLILAHREC
jgi:hypothetical protein